MDVFSVFSMTMDRFKEIGLFDPMAQELGYIYFETVYRNIIQFVAGSFEELPIDNIRVVIKYLFETFPDINENIYMNDDDRNELKKAKTLFE